jgi:hypothetical protein
MPARPKGAGADVGHCPLRISLFVLTALSSIYQSLKRSDKSVNPLNPGSNRRCGCADAWMRRLEIVINLTTSVNSKL